MNILPSLGSCFTDDCMINTWGNICYKTLIGLTKLLINVCTFSQNCQMQTHSRRDNNFFFKSIFPIKFGWMNYFLIRYNTFTKSFYLLVISQSDTQLLCLLRILHVITSKAKHSWNTFENQTISAFNSLVHHLLMCERDSNALHINQNIIFMSNTKGVEIEIAIKLISLKSFQSFVQIFSEVRYVMHQNFGINMKKKIIHLFGK